jgi:hypothetical protein
MIKISKIALFSIPFLGLIIMQGCLKPQEFSIEPIIEYKGFTAGSDSATLSFTFTDGDGDVGFNEGEVTPPFDTGSIYHYNVFLDYYEKVNGVWQQGMLNGKPISFNYRTALLTPDGNNKALKGEIIVHILPFYYNPGSPDSDTIMYKVRMCDRALHLSNQVDTPEIIVP